MEPTLIIFLKAPRLGRVKSRLAEFIGEEAALEAYRILVEQQMASLPQGWNIEVHYTPMDARDEMRAWLGAAPYSYYPQVEGDLGNRLRHAQQDAFKRNAEKVLFIGGDCPYLTRKILDEAATYIKPQTVVLGPAADGGYYLLGLQEPHPQIFENIEWSTSQVLEQTIALARAHSLSLSFLKMLEDVDDFPTWERYQEAQAEVQRTSL